MSRFKVAVVGATGAVGRQLLSVLAQRHFPMRELVAFATKRSQGVELQCGTLAVPCRILEPGCFEGVSFAFFDASDAVSRECVPHAAKAGAWVIDNSAAFRMDESVPLIVPEVNPEALALAGKRIVAGPNCSTVQMVLALKPLRDLWGLKRVVVSTYQSTSGAGTAAMDELKAQTSDVLAGAEPGLHAFSHQIAFNCIPQIGGFGPDGYTSEEQKMIQESRKILGLPALRITATAVRVPTLLSHGESINIEFEKPFSVEIAREALMSQDGIIVQDEPAEGVYPMGLTSSGDRVEHASGRDAVYVGRIRRDMSVENGLNLWVVSDNLRKGAALNAVQIGELLVRRDFG